MDTSKEYIKMCRQAQKYLDPRAKDICEGNNIFYDGNWGMYFQEQFYREGSYFYGDIIIWEREIFKLYRQDQLQEILSNEKDFYKINKLRDWIGKTYIANNKGIGPCFYFSSMEQLWLAFVMEEKFNKKWDLENKEWVENA